MALMHSSFSAGCGYRIESYHKAAGAAVEKVKRMSESMMPTVLTMSISTSVAKYEDHHELLTEAKRLAST